MTETVLLDRRRRRVRGLLAGVAAVAGLAVASPVVAAPDVPPPDAPATDDARLIPVPAGCVAPQLADVAFIGTVVGKDHLDEFVRFRIDQLRSGSASSWAVDGLIDVRYGIDFRFLDEGEQYLVGAGFDPEYGRLSSKVRPDTPLFGGNDVVGLEDASIECPVLEDPVLTIHADGTSVDSGVLSLLFEDRRLLAATVAVPLAIAFAVMMGLVLLRFLSGAAMKGVFALGRSAVTPTVDHRAVRIRSHRTGEEHSSRF